MTFKIKISKKQKVSSLEEDGPGKSSMAEASPLDYSIGSWASRAWWLLLIAFAFRFVSLTLKPPHFDESINGWFVIQMWKQGFYKYDPNNFHGPLYFYLLQFSELIFGKGIHSLRIITSLISLGTVFMSLRFRDFFGNAATKASWILAVSPAFVFYGRYAIHETLLILAQMIFAYGFIAWRIYGGKRGWHWMFVGLVVMISTKETFFIFVGTWFIAYFLTEILEKKLPSSLAFPADLIGHNRNIETQRRPTPKHEILDGFSWSALWLALLFTGFFMRPEGLSDLFKAYAVWTKTGTGGHTGHEKPFHYWLTLLLQYEWPILLALLLSPIVLLKGSRWMRVFAFTGGGLFIAYSIISYKTPWCILGIIWPLAMALGFIIEEVNQLFSRRFASSILLLVFVASVGMVIQTYQLNFINYSRPEIVSIGAYVNQKVSGLKKVFFRNENELGTEEVKPSEPYVYVQTYNDVNRAMSSLHARIKLFPEDLDMQIEVLNKDAWPFPWLLGGFTRVQYHRSVPDLRDADVIFVDGTDVRGVQENLSTKYLRMDLHVRDAQDAGFIFYKYDKFVNLVSPAALVFEAGQEFLLKQNSLEQKPLQLRPAENEPLKEASLKQNEKRSSRSSKRIKQEKINELQPHKPAEVLTPKDRVSEGGEGR